MSWWQGRSGTWWWAIAVIVVPVTAIAAAAVAALLLLVHSDNATNRIELIKTGLTVGAGTGGIVALVLNGRRQWSTERSSAASEHDATQRRITDLYGKAVDQLGSDKAPVRLGGLYALERLAQNNPDLRETVVDVLCAYLRMPYPLLDPPAADAGEKEVERFELHTQERQVRLTAQRLLGRHLRPARGRDGRPTNPRYWSTPTGAPIGLDLTNAALIDMDLVSCLLGASTFVGAIFTGDTGFDGATFTGDTWFMRATFTGDASFTWTTFTRDTWFDGATFTGDASFTRATFTRDTWFDGATFTRNARFDEATFTKRTVFTKATFTEDTVFFLATFGGPARFDSATFTESAWFSRATFAGGAWFGSATFPREDSGTFIGLMDFEGATVTGTLDLADVEDKAAGLIRSQARLAASVPAEGEEFV